MQSRSESDSDSDSDSNSNSDSKNLYSSNTEVMIKCAVPGCSQTRITTIHDFMLNKDSGCPIHSKECIAAQNHEYRMACELTKQKGMDMVIACEVTKQACEVTKQKEKDIVILKLQMKLERIRKRNRL